MRFTLPLALACGLLSGCNLHARNNDDRPVNLGFDGDTLVALGTGGLLVEGERVELPAPMDSVDDVSLSESLALALDADDGWLVAFDRTRGAFAGAPLRVEVGPYSGVSHVADVAVVSGGTSAISVIDVSPDGDLSLRSELELFRGQPDVTVLSRDYALLSTHFSGSTDEFVDGAEFGVTLLDLATESAADAVGLVGAGFTEGGGTPASWPVRAAPTPGGALVAHGAGLSFVSQRDASLELVRTLPLGAPGIDVSTVGVGEIGAALTTEAVVFIDVVGREILATVPLGAEGVGASAIALISLERAAIAAPGGVVFIDR